MTDSIRDTALPNDIEALKVLIAVRDEAISERDATIERLTRHAELLQEQLNLAIARRYSARSEKGPSPQMGLFDEAEVEAEREALATEEPPVAESVVAGHIRKARGYRKPLPAALPRVDIIHELPEDERLGPDGQPLVVIGEEVSEQLDIVPATIRVLRHVRLKYGQACAGPQYARRDIQVALAPSVSAQLMISPLRSEMPRPSCGRAVRFSGAQEARPQ